MTLVYKNEYKTYPLSLDLRRDWNQKRKDNSTMTTQIANETLKNQIERIERLEEEKRGISEDIKEVYAGAKAVGFDPKIMRKLVNLRKLDPSDRNEEETLLATYMLALGMEV